MARAKDTSRAEARRRYRSQQSTALLADEADDEDEPIPAEVVAQPRRSMFRMPDVLGDIRALPRMFIQRKLLWLPFILVIGAFAAGLASFRGLLPAGMPQDGARLAVDLLLPPQALLAYFLGGFLAPRGSYLVGMLLGLLTAPLYGLIIFEDPASDLAAQGIVVTDVLPTLLIQGLLFGTFGAAFAAWYRTFLRSTQERSRQNRIAREQQSRLRAKEQERKDREAAREARRTSQTTAGKPST